MRFIHSFKKNCVRSLKSLKSKKIFLIVIFLTIGISAQVFIPFGFFMALGVKITSISNIDGPQNVTVSSTFTLTNAKTLSCSGTYLTATSSNVAVVPVVNITFSGTWPNCLVSMFSPVSTGTSTITVTVKNQYNHQASSSFTFTAIPKPVMAFSFRKLLKNYLGSAMRVRRVSDNAEQDIGFDVNGNFDLTAYNTFKGASSVTVKIWYDQSGNGYNATQTTNASQPTISINTFNGAPEIEFAGAYWMQTTQAQNVLNLNRDVTVFFAGRATTVSQVNYGSYSGGGIDRVGIHLNWSDNVIYWDSPGACCGAPRLTYGNAANVGLPKVYVFGRADTDQYIKINGTTVASKTGVAGTYATPTNLWYLGSGNASASSTSQLAEYMQYTTGLTDTQVTSITNEQKNYFGL